MANGGSLTQVTRVRKWKVSRIGENTITKSAIRFSSYDGSNPGTQEGMAFRGVYFGTAQQSGSVVV